MNKLMDVDKNIINIINKLKEQQIEIDELPEEFALNPQIVRTERQLGLRKTGHRGFDVITQTFFVEEDLFYKGLSGNLISKPHKMVFDSFKGYYEFLDGDIYEAACYYQYTFEDEFSKNLNLDMDKLTKVKSFVTKTIDDYSHILSQDEIEEYNHIEKTNKKIVKQWINKFMNCNTYEELKRVCNNFQKSTVAKYKPLKFFLVQYALKYKYSKKHFNIIMKYLSNDYYNNDITLILCLIYKPEDVYETYNFTQESSQTNYKQKKEVKNFIEELKKQDVKIAVISYFDKITHYYCEKIQIYHYRNYQGRKFLNYWDDIEQTFETFNEFIKYRNGNLKNCDLSSAIDLDVDFSKYIIDNTTKLPIRENTNLNYDILKAYKNGEFIVKQFWSNENNKIIKQQVHKFSYFFDFVAFLKGDLSGTDLLFCTGIQNLSNINEINLSDVKMTSKLCKQFNIPYKSYDYDENLIDEFSIVEKNEKETALILQTSREIIPFDNNMFLWANNKISYISDLHLMHRIKNAGCKSDEDVIYIIQKIVDNILNECTSLTLIGGDVSSEFSIFELFVKILRKSTNSFYQQKFVFVLGNHELWSFPELSVNDIVNKYRTVLKENGMYLLHNDLFYRNEFDDMGIIPYNKLMELDNQVILEKLRCTRLVILGGLGFSGYNKEFNANDGIYRTTVNRNIEIQESKKFEQLYDKLTDVLAKKNTIIFTHTPKKDWCADVNCHDDFVYVNGHTHRNMFFDDGVKRIYADNQIGYRNESPHLKSFLMDGEYDYFGDYEDGIYEITSQEYQDFSRGKNISMTFNRQINILYMLKKNGYYCFIHKTKTGPLSMLNGGALKKLDIKDVNYYYDNMDTMIASIDTPLKRYTSYQESIANEIKKIGGSGRIHGCIIDIDYFNHVYVNPVDMTIRSYWAANIFYKIAYSSISDLLKDKCPELYNNYLKVIEGDKSNPLIQKQVNVELALQPQIYLETDIYKVSREIKKMQKLSSNILTTWYDSLLPQNKLLK